MKKMRKRKSTRGARTVQIYENLEQIFAEKGRKSLWPKQKFKHKFQKGAAVFGVSKGGAVRLKEGDLIIRSRRGKRLWKMFDYQ